MRPKGWEELVEKYMPKETPYDPDPMLADRAFEAGADAILEGLRNQQMNSKGEFPNIQQLGTDPPMFSIHVPKQKGYIVFIEEE